MSDFVEKMAAAGQLTPEQVERIGRRVAQFKKEAEKNPEFMAEALEKLAAGGPGLMSYFAQNWKPVAATAATIGISQVAGDIYQSAKNSIMKSRRYKGMLDANPELAKQPAAKVQRVFNTLHTFNPNYAADPMVAGQFVQDSLDMERMPVEQVNQLVQARKNIVQSQPSSMMDRLQGPMQMLQTAQNVAGAPEQAQQRRELASRQKTELHMKRRKHMQDMGYDPVHLPNPER